MRGPRWAFGGVWVVACAPSPNADPAAADVAGDTDVSDDSDVLGPCERAAQAQIGEGEFTHRAVEDGGDLFLVHGAQGGWHVPVSLRLTGVTELVRLIVDVHDPASGLRMSLSGEPFRRNVVVAKDDLAAPWACEGSVPGNDYILALGGPDGDEATSLSEELCGYPVDISVVVMSDLGDVLTDTTLRVTLQPDPIEDGPACRP